MSILDVFNNDAFTLVNMTGAINKVESVPGQIGQMGLFRFNPIREKLVGVEVRENGLSLIPTSQRGAPLEQRTEGKRKMYHFETTRVGKGDTITASELAFLREFGTEDQVVELQREIARRQTGAGGLMDDMEATFEHMRLGALQGKLLDADGSVLYDFFDEFGITENPEIAFNLTVTKDGDLRKMIKQQVLRPMRKKAKGARYSTVHALCGEKFFDDLIANPEVRGTYETQQAGAELRESYEGRTVNFGGVVWEEYEGTDDDTTIAVDEDKCIFTPGGVNNTVLEHVASPGEAFEHLGKQGERIYSEINLEQRQNPRYAELEVIAYPLFLNKRPEMIFKGRRGA